MTDAAGSAFASIVRSASSGSGGERSSAARCWASAPDDPSSMMEILGTRQEVEAALRLQEGIRRLRARRLAAEAEQAEAEGAAAARLQAAARGASARSVLEAEKAAATAIQKQVRRRSGAEFSTPPEYPSPETVPPAAEAAAASIQSVYRGHVVRRPSGLTVDDADAPFTIRNLDTGEAVALQVGGEQLVWEQLSYSTLSSNPAAWEALKAESKGLLEKLASKSTFSIRSYQLCVWQERWVFAADDALCYQHLSADMQPTGKQKRIPYSTIEFVGPFDDTQFVVKCARRAYTFLCDSTDTRNKWIVNISKLSGCSSSTQVCHKTTTMGH